MKPTDLVDMIVEVILAQKVGAEPFIHARDPAALAGAIAGVVAKWAGGNPWPLSDRRMLADNPLPQFMGIPIRECAGLPPGLAIMSFSDGRLVAIPFRSTGGDDYETTNHEPAAASLAGSARSNTDAPG